VAPAALTVLKAVFLALLYLFVFWALRAARAELGTEPKAAAAPAAAPATSDGRPPPRSLALTDEHGASIGAVPLSGPVQVGRSPSCQIPLTDTFASSIHARLFARDGSWFVEDLGSTNGTYVNERRVTAPAEIKVGDRVRVGRTLLEVRP
jgi:hypothetical protein